MIYLYWIILLLYAAVIVFALVRVLMDNRQPAKTLAWILVLSFIPVIGVVFYFFFGQDTRRERMISERSLQQLTKRSMLEFAEQSGLALPTAHERVIRMFANQNWALPFKDNHVEILTDGYQFVLSLLQAIGSAQAHIHMVSYIIVDDALGNLVADALIDKARQGVEVRLIYDDVGCWNVSNRFFERMRDAGIDVQSFMPVRFPAFTSKVNYLNYCMLCVIDGRVGFIGGMNIALRYVKGTARHAWRDTHLRVEGGVVYAIQRAFLIDWYFVDRTLITNRKYYPMLDTMPNDCIAQVVTSSPIMPWPDIMQGYVRILLEARHYVYIETPYFMPTDPVLFAMCTAAQAGVDVRLMVPAHSDAKLPEWATRSFVGQVVAAGVKVYLYQAGFNHSKLLVTDDSLCTCGSTNVDFRSFENNFESNIFFYDSQMALRMKQVFNDDLAHCQLLTSESAFMHRGFGQRLWESIIRLFSPLM